MTSVRFTSASNAQMKEAAGNGMFSRLFPDMSPKDRKSLSLLFLKRAMDENGRRMGATAQKIDPPHVPEVSAAERRSAPTVRTYEINQRILSKDAITLDAFSKEMAPDVGREFQRMRSDNYLGLRRLESLAESVDGDFTMIKDREIREMSLEGSSKPLGEVFSMEFFGNEGVSGRRESLERLHGDILVPVMKFYDKRVFHVPSPNSRFERLSHNGVGKEIVVEDIDAWEIVEDIKKNDMNARLGLVAYGEAENGGMGSVFLSSRFFFNGFEVGNVFVDNMFLNNIRLKIL